MTIQLKSIELYFHVVLCTMLCVFNLWMKFCFIFFFFFCMAAVWSNGSYIPSLLSLLRLLVLLLSPQAPEIKSNKLFNTRNRCQGFGIPYKVNNTTRTGNSSRYLQCFRAIHARRQHHFLLGRPTKSKNNEKTV